MRLGLFDSRSYWERRYSHGQSSGAGSEGKLASFKAEVVNGFVSQHRIDTVIEFGCGDGRQLSLANYPRYIGFDVSPTAIRTCREKFANEATKVFKQLEDYGGERANLTLSLDAIYHLVEDNAYHAYMKLLFAASTRFVIIYSSNFETTGRTGPRHVRHRRFAAWIDDCAKVWTLKSYVPNRYPHVTSGREGSFADFYIYQRS